MNRPEVRVVQSQQIETNDNPNIDSWEAEQLLRKYGYQSSSNNTNIPETNVDNGLSFEEMVAQEEIRLKNEQMKRDQQMRGPKPISFDGRNGYYSETTYGSDSDSGFSFKIEVTSDMNIPKKY
jgi:hypothetical protein